MVSFLTSNLHAVLQQEIFHLYNKEYAGDFRKREGLYFQAKFTHPLVNSANTDEEKEWLVDK